MTTSEPPNSSLFEQVVADRGDARTGHLDQHLSATFQQIAGFAFEIFFEKDQRSLRVIVHQDAHQFENVLVFEN
jgi:hypothetical protein